VIEISHQIIRRFLQFDKINQQSNIVEFSPARVDFDLLILSVQVLALPLLATQLMRAGKVSFNHDFKLSRHD